MRCRHFVYLKKNLTSVSLHIRISDTDFCFACSGNRTGEAFTFVPYNVRPQVSLAMNLREAIEQVPLLQNLPPQIEICVNGRVTPVPLAEFQEEDAETIYNYCFRSDVANRVFYDTVPASNIVLLFALEETTCRIIEETFGADVHYTAALTHVVQHFATKAQGMGKQNGRRIFVYTHDGVVDIAVMEDARLLMLNTYNVRTLTDVDYYVFNLAHHLGVNIAETPVFVAGIPALRDPVVDELQKYAPAVYAVNPAAEFNRSAASTHAGVPYDLICALHRK